MRHRLQLSFSCSAALLVLAAFVLLPADRSRSPDSIRSIPLETLVERHDAFFHAIAGDLTRGLVVSGDDTPTLFGYLRVRLTDFTEQALDAGLTPPAGLACYGPDGSMLAWAGFIHDSAIDFDQFREAGSGVFAVETAAGESRIYRNTGEDGRTCAVTLIETMHSGIDTGEEVVALDSRRSTPVESSVAVRLARMGWCIAVVLWCFGLVLFIPARWPILRLIGAAAGGYGLYVLLFATGFVFDFFTPEWFDPRYFAGEAPFPPLAAHLLVVSILAAIASAISSVPLHGRFFRFFAYPVGISASAFIGILAKDLTESLVANTSISWWPDCLDPRVGATIAAPLSLILLMPAALRVILRLMVPALETASRTNRILYGLVCVSGGLAGQLLLTDPDPAMLTLAVALPLTSYLLARPGLSGRYAFRELTAALVLMLSATALFLTPAAHRASREAVRQSLDHWIDDQDLLRRFALETNLDEMRLREALVQAITGTLPYQAFELWAEADLSAVSQSHCIELYDVHRRLVDRFGPGIDFRELPPLYFDQMDDSGGQSVFTPWFQRAGEIGRASCRERV